MGWNHQLLVMLCLFGGLFGGLFVGLFDVPKQETAVFGDVLFFHVFQMCHFFVSASREVA